jgi:predicted glutamine amidotransferase
MCQLLGMNCNVPTDIVFSFTGFQARGGLTDVHTDGWGIAFFEDRGLRQFLDSKPSAHSPVAELVRNYPIKSTHVIAHIRKATQGKVALENTHPFQRELWGRYWAFAHNGNLVGFEPEFHGPYRPVGDTDSEKAFCFLMQELKAEFGDQAPSDKALFESIKRLTLMIGAKGEFNFLLSNGQLMFAHCSTRLCSIVRQAPFSVASLKDQDVSVDFSSVTTEKDRVAVIATLPLTENETWKVHEPGTLLLFRDGISVFETATVAGPPRDNASKTPLQNT